MINFFVRPIIRPPANLYKNDGGGGGGEGGSKIRVSRNGQKVKGAFIANEEFWSPPPLRSL